MPGKGEVGKLHVKVIPDLSRFADDLKKKLKKIQKQVGELEVEFKADVNLNEESLKKAKEKVEKTDAKVDTSVVLEQRTLQALKQKIQNIKSEVNVRADLSEEQKQKLKQQLDGLRSKINLSTRPQDLAKIKNDVRLAAKDVKAEISASERSMQQVKHSLAALKADIPVDAKLSKSAKAELKKRIESIHNKIDIDAHLSEESKKKLKHELKKLDGKATVNADLDDGKARFDLKRLLRPRKLTINVHLGKAALARALAQIKALAGGNIFENIGRNLNDMLRNLDTAAVKFATLGTAIGGIISVAGGGIGIISSLAVGLAKATPALLALPGVMGAAGAGVGIFIAAMKDAKEVLEDLKPQFEALQASISTSFWDQAAGSIRNFATNAIGALSPIITEVAAEMGVMTAAVAEAANNHIPGFERSLTYLRDALSVGGAGAAAFTNGLLTIGEVGAKYLPEIAVWANNLAFSFEAWATKAAESGKMDQSIRSAARAFGTLKDIVVDLGGIIGGLFKAMAAGSAPIDSIAAALDKANKAVNGPLFQSTLTQVFSAMGEAAGHAFAGVGSLGEAFVSLAPTLSVILPLIGQIIEVGLKGISTALQDPAFQEGLIQFFEGVLQAVQALAPAMPSLAQAFGAVASVMGTLLAAVAPLVATLIEQLAPVFTQLAVLLTPIIQQLGELLMPVIQALGPILQELFTQLAPIINELLAALVPLIPPIVEAITGLLIPAFQLIGTVVQALMPIVTVIFNTIAGVITAAMQVIQGIINVVLGIIKGDWSLVWEGIKQIASGFWNFFVTAWTGFGNMIVAIAKAAWALLGNAISAGWELIKSGASAAWNGITSAISSAVSSVVNTVKGLPNSIKNIFSNAGRWLWDAGKKVIQGLIDGLKSKFSSVANSLKSLTSKLPSWKGPEAVDKTILRKAGRLVMQGFKEGLEETYGDVRDSLTGFTSDLTVDVAPKMAANVTGDYSKAVKQTGGENKTVGGRLVPAENRGHGTVVNITNNYPQQQRDSKTRDDVADGIRLAGAL